MCRACSFAASTSSSSTSTPCAFEPRDDLAHERRSDAGAARRGTHVEAREIADARSRLLGDREPGRLAVALCDQDVPALAEALLDLREILLGVVVAMRRVLELGHELPEELADERQVGVGGFADHGMRWESNR